MSHLLPRSLFSFSFTSLAAVAAFGAFAATAVVACDTEDAAKAVVENGYPAAPDADPAKQTVVYRAWWVATYFPDPVAGASTSNEQRAVPATDVAYAVLAPGWDPASPTPPTRLLVVKSKAPFTSVRGDTLHIAVGDQTFAGNCAAQQPLSQDEADFVTQRIFPGEFTGLTYDAATCTTSPLPGAGGSAGDAGTTDSGD